MNEPTIRLLDDGDRAALEAFLLPRLRTSLFLLSNSRFAGLTYHGERFQGTYAAAFENDEIVAAGSQFWNGNLNLQAPQHLESLVHFIIEQSKRPVKGAIGPASQVQQTVDVLQLELNKQTIHFDEREDLFELDLHELKMPSALTQGKVVGRRIESKDVDTVAAFTYQYRVEAVNDIPSDELRERCINDTQQSVTLGNRWVVEDPATGTLLSVSGFNAFIDEAVQVGGVWTPHEFRGKGYARCAVAASLRDKHTEGVGKSILFTGLDNEPAQRAYRALGFKRIGDYRILMLR